MQNPGYNLKALEQDYAAMVMGQMIADCIMHLYMHHMMKLLGELLWKLKNVNGLYLLQTNVLVDIIENKNKLPLQADSSSETINNRKFALSYG